MSPPHHCQHFLNYPFNPPRPSSFFPPIRHRLNNLHRSVEPYSPPLFQARFDFLPGHHPLSPASNTFPCASVLCLPGPATQCPSWTLKYRSVGPFLLSLPLYVCPPFASLRVVSVPVGPSGFSFLRVHTYASIAPVRSPPLPPSTCHPEPLSFLRSFAPQVSGYPASFLFTTSYPAPVPPHLLVSFGVL